MNPYAQIARDAGLSPGPSEIPMRGALATFVPRPRLSLAAWAEKHVVITGGPEPGRLRLDRTPYARGILEAISNPDVEEVVIQAASQMSKSTLIGCAAAYFAAAQPSAQLYVNATDEMVTAFSKETLRPTFQASPVMRDLISQGRKDQDSTIKLMLYPGGSLAMAAATSSSQLSARSVQRLFLDEVDKYDAQTVGKRDGSPVLQALQRTANFGSNRTVLYASTPTIKGRSPIERLYEDSTRNRLWTPCVHCNEMFCASWADIRYKRPDGSVDTDHCHIDCPACGCEILERHRPQMLERCEWRPENPSASRVGFALSGIHSPWQSWKSFAELWIRASRDKDRHGMQEFYNLKLGESWAEEQTKQVVTVEALESHRHEYEAEIPDAVLLLTAAIDVQDSRLEIEIVGWSVGRESFGIEYIILPGDTSLDDVWQQASSVLGRARYKANGTGMLPMVVLCDSGGHRTDKVYAVCRQHAARYWLPIHGQGRPGLPIIGKPSLNHLRMPHYAIGSDNAKAAAAGHLAIDQPGPGYCHWPIDPARAHRGYDANYFASLLSERLTLRKGRWIWETLRRANESWDLRQYNEAAIELIVSQRPELLTLESASAQHRTAPAPRGRRMLSHGVTW